MAISEARRYVEEDEQLTSSCFITAKPSKWVMADSITLVQWSSKYLLHEKLDPFNMSVGHMGVSNRAAQSFIWLVTNLELAARCYA